MNLTSPVIRSHYGNGFVKHSVGNHVLLRTEPAAHNVRDYGCQKAVENLLQLRQNMSSFVDNCHHVQQDILETFMDRGQLRKLAAPTFLPNGKRIPGLKLDHPRQLELMHSLVRFSHIAAQSTFTTSEIYAGTVAALEVSKQDNRLASLRYDLSKLRAKGLASGKGSAFPALSPVTRRLLRLPDILKLFERIYTPLTAGLLSPVSTDSQRTSKNVFHSTASIRASLTTSTNSWPPSVSKPSETNL